MVEDTIRIAYNKARKIGESEILSRVKENISVKISFDEQIDKPNTRHLTTQIDWYKLCWRSQKDVKLIILKELIQLHTLYVK